VLDEQQSWIVCQLGAREHYAVPLALYRRGALERLVTDVWLSPLNPLGAVKRGLRERWRHELAGATVSAANLGSISHELLYMARALGGWPRIIARNDRFQRFAIRALAAGGLGGRRTTVFAYSYAALEIFRFARKRGWRTVLGQIDPGPQEEAIVARLYKQCPEQLGRWTPAPSEYWRLWKLECALADCIIVNSAWASSALKQEGVNSEKIHVIPLAYQHPQDTVDFCRFYPDYFSVERPLRVLFLGQINLRKGLGPLFDGIRLLSKENIEFWFAGETQISVPEDIARNSKVKWFGQVPRGDTGRLYREADVFIFPTYSDGFGLTQLEAQAWRLPIVASRFCGDVVRHEVNGLLLDELTPESIAGALYCCMKNPYKLSNLSCNSVSRSLFCIDKMSLGLIRSIELNYSDK
jgi:glycosyltransferase involved in cell wall biosynthesis